MIPSIYQVLAVSLIGGLSTEKLAVHGIHFHSFIHDYVCDCWVMYVLLPGWAINTFGMFREIIKPEPINFLFQYPNGHPDQPPIRAHRRVAQGWLRDRRPQPWARSGVQACAHRAEAEGIWCSAASEEGETTADWCQETSWCLYASECNQEHTLHSFVSGCYLTLNDETQNSR